MNRWKISLGKAAAAVFFAAISIASGAQPVSGNEAFLTKRAQLAARLNTVLDSAVQQQRIVGGVVLVSQGGQLLYRQAVGQADRESRRLMQPGTVFRLASMSKPIVTMAAMRLVELGRLDLDAPVTRYLPDFRPPLPGPDGQISYPAISVRQLLTHTSGLGYGFAEGAEGAYARLGVSDGLDASSISLADNLHRLAQAPLYFAPGAQWRYSLGIDVLGSVLEKVEHAPLPEVVDRLVTRPLGMQHTGFVASRGDSLAIPYADGPLHPVRMTENMAVPLPPGLGAAVRFSPARAFDRQAFPSGGGGMLGNADDYWKLLESIRTGKGVLQASTVATMLKDQVGPQARTQGPGWGFGYGWGVLVDPKPTRTPQSPGTVQWGGAYGHNWFVDPARQLSVILLTNTAFEGMSGRLVTEVRDAVYGALEE
ncbi:serine hydrolase domain-containing protein [Comamonas sp.]|jgi:CubicO group peptidase (beta-lactamase class C family)|uniref:serine hydrolase domain-containing protein n=1 Tax=Comamonas sp. TaxID=34028 RepID=UPI0035E1268A